MKPLRMILPLNNDCVMSPEHRSLLNSLGQEPEWMVLWVLNKWSLMRNPDSADVYERLYTDIEEQVDGYNIDDEGQARLIDAIVEENMDKLAEAAQEVYSQLAPFVGQLPREFNDIQCHPFGVCDMMLTFDQEAA